MDKTVQEIYGSRVRVRVCGLCWQDDDLLMVNHRGMYGHDFWAPPGGGVEFGESLDSGLKREFAEETGLNVGICGQQFVCEFIKPPLHAVEVFFEVDVAGGQVLTGKDPEMQNGHQIIYSVRYMPIEEIRALPESHKHGIFRFAPTAARLRALTGYFKI